MTLKILPHGRLQEWAAQERGYFTAEGRDGVSKAGVDAYLAALRRAQQEIDLHPEAHKHYHLGTVTEKYRDRVDVRAFGTGERIVFLPYTREVFAATQEWAQDRDMFPEMPSPAGYDEAVLA